MKTMSFGNKIKNHNTLPTENEGANDLLFYLVDDPKTLKYNDFIGKKFNRADEQKDMFGTAKERVYENILFSEADKNKVVRYLSLNAFIDPKGVCRRNPFLDMCPSDMRAIVYYINSNKFIQLPQEYQASPKARLDLALSKCKTIAYFVQMLSKMGKHYHAIPLVEESLTPNLKETICVGALAIFEEYTSGEGNYADILLGTYSTFQMPNRSEDMTVEVALKMYRYLLTKFFRFYLVYLQLNESAFSMNEQFSGFFTMDASTTFEDTKFPVNDCDTRDLNKLVLLLTAWITQEQSLMDLLVIIQNFLAASSEQ